MDGWAVFISVFLINEISGHDAHSTTRRTHANHICAFEKVTTQLGTWIINIWVKNINIVTQGLKKIIEA